MGAVPDFARRRSAARLFMELAATTGDVRASQALRYRVFAEELGADLRGGREGLDDDRSAPYCQHLLVREGATGKVVGSTRLLLDAQAHKAGGFCSQGEFELAPLLALPRRRLEAGRICIDPNFLQG